MKRKHQVYTPQLNHISMKLSPFPLLSQRDMIEPNAFCNETTVKDCEKDFCSCSHVLQVKLNSVVEIVLVDEGNFNKIFSKSIYYFINAFILYSNLFN